MTYAYLASPYSGTPEQMQHRYEQVRECACNLLQNQHVFSPIVHCHPMALRYAMPTDAKYWEAYNMAMMSRASRLLILAVDGWRESKGVAFERLPK